MARFDHSFIGKRSTTTYWFEHLENLAKRFQLLHMPHAMQYLRRRGTQYPFVLFLYPFLHLQFPLRHTSSRLQLHSSKKRVITKTINNILFHEHADEMMEDTRPKRRVVPSWL